MHGDIDQPELRELDRRSRDGFEVTLLWSRRTGSVFVCVEDELLPGGFHFAVDPADALEAFRHPYAYRGGRRAAAESTAFGAAAARGCG